MARAILFHLCLPNRDPGPLAPAAHGIIYTGDVCAHADAGPPTHVFFIDEISRAKTTSRVFRLRGRALPRNNIDLRPVEISSDVLAHRQGPRAKRLPSPIPKPQRTLSDESPPPSPVFVSFTLSSTGADGRTLISPFRSFRRELPGSANTNLT